MLLQFEEGELGVRCSGGGCTSRGLFLFQNDTASPGVLPGSLAPALEAKQ